MVNARITRIPLKFSLEMRLMDSSDICWFSLSGLEIRATRTTPPTISGMVARMTTDKLKDALNTRKMLPAIMTGVMRAVRNRMFKNI